jgi:hypothetical protein
VALADGFCFTVAAKSRYLRPCSGDAVHASCDREENLLKHLVNLQTGWPRAASHDAGHHLAGNVPSDGSN